MRRSTPQRRCTHTDVPSFPTILSVLRNSTLIRTKQPTVRLSSASTQVIPTRCTGITKFSDLEPEEFRRLYLSKPMPSFMKDSPRATQIPSANEDLPDNFDWRHKGAVTGMKDQGYGSSLLQFSVNFHATNTCCSPTSPHYHTHLIVNAVCTWLSLTGISVQVLSIVNIHH